MNASALSIRFLSIGSNPEFLLLWVIENLRIIKIFLILPIPEEGR